MSEFYTGPVTADLSNTDLTLTAPAIATFWQDALTHDRATMRIRWAEQRYPDMHRALAAQIIDDVEFMKEAAQ